MLTYVGHFGLLQAAHSKMHWMTKNMQQASVDIATVSN